MVPFVLETALLGHRIVYHTDCLVRPNVLRGQKARPLSTATCPSQPYKPHRRARESPILTPEHKKAAPFPKLLNKNVLS